MPEEEASSTDPLALEENMKRISPIINILLGVAMLLTACNLKDKPPQIHPPATPTPKPALSTWTPTPAAGSGETTGPTLSLTQNANCRAGPDTVYEIVDTLLKGQMVLIKGQNEDHDWLWVEKPYGSGNCWVSSSMGMVSGDLIDVAVVAAPPLPPVAVETPYLSTATLILADLTPPVISGVTITPTTIQQAGCGSPATFTISAIVTDDSGIGNVIYEILGPGTMDAGDGYLLPAGGDLFQAVVGPIAGSLGDWTITLTSVDMAYNTATAGPWTIQVMCIG
jgi:hypothetical protein